VVAHFFVMLIQMTLALPFLDGGLAENRAVATVASMLWVFVMGGVLGVWLSRTRRIRFPGIEGVVAFIDRFPPRRLLPFLWGFAALAAFDVLIQGMASRAFGVDIPWSALAARIPVVYLSFLVPTLGNFGTRELAWAALFSDFGSRDALIAYALSINAIFLVLNALIGVAYLPRALELISAARRAQREGEGLPRTLLPDPNDP
jgi:ABC-type proline/glycine betaine transport system permease subunit